jgi:hypothetical protein
MLLQYLIQTGADFAQQAIANLMAQGVVNFLEVVQVEQEKADFLTRLQGGGHIAELPVQQGAIGQAGQGIVESLIFKVIQLYGIRECE